MPTDDPALIRARIAVEAFGRAHPTWDHGGRCCAWTDGLSTATVDLIGEWQAWCAEQKVLLARADEQHMVIAWNQHLGERGA